MKQLLSLVAQDLVGSVRDNIVLYVLAAPVILALLLRFLLPSMEAAELHFAVLEQGRGVEAAEALDGYGRVEPFRTLAELEARVLRSDDVPGFVVSDGGVELVLEGNENPQIVQAWKTIAGWMREGADPLDRVERDDLGGEPSYTREYVTLFMVVLTTLFAAMVAGFNYVDERESGTVRALAASPLTLRSYLAARLVFVTAMGGLMSGLAIAAFGARGVPVGKLALVLVAAGPVASLLSYAVALLASTQIAALGTAKLLVPAYTLFPFLGTVLPESWHWTLFAFPPYWVFAALRAILVAKPFFLPFWVSLLVLVAGGAAATLAMTPLLRRRFGLR